MDSFTETLPEVLLVEDQRAVRRHIKKMIMEMKLFKDIEEAEDGLQAWERIQERTANQFSLVISDIHMPRLDGISLIRLCREDMRYSCRYIPFLLISGDSKLETVGMAGEWGITEFLIKPITYATLFDRLRALLKRIQNPAEVSYNEIDWLRVNHNYGKALDKLNLVDFDLLSSRSPKWLNLKGEILMHMGEIDQSRTYFEKAIEGCDIYLRALKNYADVQRKLRNLPQSVEALEKVDSFSPDIDRKILLGEMLLEMGRKEEAVKLFVQTAKLPAKDMEAHIRIAETLQNSGFHGEAEEVYDGLLHDSASVKAQPVEVYLRVAKSLRKQKRYDDAESHYLKALELSPKDARILYNLAVLYIYVNQEDKKRKACRLLLKALEIDPYFVQALRVYEQYCVDDGGESDDL